MDNLDNLPLPPTPASEQSPAVRKINRGKFFLYTVFIVVSLTVIWLSRQPHVQATILNWPQHSLWENVKQLVSGQDKMLEGEADGRINFLLLGQGGPGHDGPYLTDTIILASLNPQTAQVGLMSIPRDLVVPIPGGGARRVNYANALGEQQSLNQGPVLASQVIGEVFGLKIHYYVRLDFDGFVKIVDQIGGLPVNVPNAFTDNSFPNDDHGYRTISFPAGWQVMSGTKALEYVRSRHGDNQQNSDFARAQRQQIILSAIKAKLLSPATFLNPRLMLKVYQTLQNSVLTNLDAADAIRLAHILRQVDTGAIQHRVLDDTADGLLKQIISLDGAYLLTPRQGDYSELKAAAADILSISTNDQNQKQTGLKNSQLP
ncbi:MAG: LCP family protein [Patescibacteria group bacterium]